MWCLSVLIALELIPYYLRNLFKSDPDILRGLTFPSRFFGFVGFFFLPLNPSPILLILHICPKPRWQSLPSPCSNETQPTSPPSCKPPVPRAPRRRAGRSPNAGYRLSPPKTGRRANPEAAPTPSPPPIPYNEALPSKAAAALRAGGLASRAAQRHESVVYCECHGDGVKNPEPQAASGNGSILFAEPPCR